MQKDDFLKEKQNIRAKMLQYSRAISQGKPLDEELIEELQSDDILRSRFKKHRSKMQNTFEYETPHSKKSNIYLKEDLINVKLEEKRSLSSIILSRFKKKHKKKSNENSQKKAKKIFAFLKKPSQQSKQILEKIKLEEKKPTANFTQNSNKKLPENALTQNQTQQTQSQQAKIKELKKAKLTQSLKNLQEKIDLEETPALSIKVQNNEEDNEKTKNILLEGFSGAIKEEKNLSFNHLLFAVLAVSFALFLFAPQIYIRNQIYYLSREIAELRAEENVLNEENKELNRRLEQMRFQNQILDYLE